MEGGWTKGGAGVSHQDKRTGPSDRSGFFVPIDGQGDCPAGKNGRPGAQGGTPFFYLSIYIDPLKLFWDFSKMA